MQRPDLTNLPAEVTAYIEYLEQQISLGRSGGKTSSAPRMDAPPAAIPPEPPGRFAVITASQNGYAKRTARHLYERQHRGGVGMVDLEIAPGDAPLLVQQVMVDQPLLVLTDRARAFRIPADRVPLEPVRAAGSHLFERLPLEPGEKLSALLPVRASGYLLLLSQEGMIRSLRHHIFGEHMRPGTALFNFQAFGPLVSACWSPGNTGVLVVTRRGMAIRFGDQLIPPQGGQAIRLQDGDEAAAVTPAGDDDGVFLISADGKGTIRRMETFAANKSMGGIGKIALRAERLAAALSVEPDEDLFLLSSVGKIIRFPAAEVPQTDGAIQGVQCMDVRRDQVLAAGRG